MAIRVYKQSGFSLVEMALVLAIIGLIVGGVVGGQSLIRNAQLGQIVSEKQKISSAIKQFSSQYDGLPGDMLNATRYWGTDPDGCPTHAVRTPKVETCNGNGNLEIAPNQGEEFRLWQHLANAGLYGHTLTGVAGPGGVAHSVVDDNVPAGPVAQTAWNIVQLGTLGDGFFAGSSVVFEGIYNNILTIGGERTNTRSNLAAFSVEEVFLIDKKFDDEIPYSGGVRVGWQNICTTSTSGSDFSARYDLTRSGELCYIIFPEIFRD